MGIRRATALAAAVLAFGHPAGARDQVISQANASDPAARQVEQLLPSAKAQVEAFFGRPFAEAPRVTLAADRAAFNAAFPPAWGMSRTECWMVGMGVADFLVLLSPAAWAREACEHDGADEQEVRDILVHELVHMYHGQRNPTRDFTGAEELEWFIEGLAVLASGQLERRHRGGAAEAIRNGAAPKALASAWRGKARYAVAGSLVQYIDATYGRRTIVELLGATKQEAVLARLGLSEGELLSRWQAWVLAQAPA